MFRGGKWIFQVYHITPIHCIFLKKGGKYIFRIQMRNSIKKKIVLKKQMVFEGKEYF